jgi:hypothetical protein
MFIQAPWRLRGAQATQPPRGHRMNDPALVLPLAEDLVAVAGHVLGGNDPRGRHRHRLGGNAHGLDEILEAGRRDHPQHAGAGRIHLEAVSHFAGAEREMPRRSLGRRCAAAE